MYYLKIWITYCTLLFRHCLYVHKGVMFGISRSLIGIRAHVSQPYIIQHNKSHQRWHMLKDILRMHRDSVQLAAYQKNIVHVQEK